MARLADIKLRLGLSGPEYISTVEQLRSTIYALDSPAVLDGALEVCEVLVANPCPAPESRVAVFAATSSVLSKWHRRTDSSQLALFGVLCSELGSGMANVIAIPQIDTDDDYLPWSSLAGRKLALYSLQESAVRRAAALLQKLIGSVKIDIFSDHVGGSPALRTSSQQADIFVITTAAAKHAATTFIESKRPASAITLYANGQGTSSILQAISRYLASLRVGSV
jgi:hypothetical protein